MVESGIDTITVRDANLCIGTTIVTVSQPDSIILTASTAAISCHGGTSSLVAAVSGGTGPFQYRLNNGAYQTSNIFNVGAGTYTITAKDANNCTATTDTTIIAQPNILTVAVTAKRIIQCGGTTEATVTASGGRPPYTGTGHYIRGPGTWSFVVADDAGCVDTAGITIEAPGCMELKVYPNPATNSIVVDHSEAEQGSKMQVFEINGALVMTKAVPSYAIQTTLDIRRLACGSYVLVFWNGNDKKSALFLKAKP